MLSLILHTSLTPICTIHVEPQCKYTLTFVRTQSVNELVTGFRSVYKIKPISLLTNLSKFLNEILF